MMTNSRPGPARERGFALLIVLWALVLLSLLAAHMTASGRTELKLASNLREAAIVEAAADGAIYQTLFHLLATRDQHWAAVGMHRIVVEGADVQVTVDNLSGRVNPNTATPELMRELLSAVGADPQRAASLAEAIVDWHTPGAPGRTKATKYRAAGLDYGPSELPFADIDELGAVLGMTPELLVRLRPHLTLWWENDPDPTFADPVVTVAMRALGDTRPRTGNIERPIQVVSIVATANNARGGQFVRHADALVNSAAPWLPWRILAWDRRSP